MFCGGGVALVTEAWVIVVMCCGGGVTEAWVVVVAFCDGGVMLVTEELTPSDTVTIANIVVTTIKIAAEFFAFPIFFARQIRPPEK